MVTMMKWEYAVLGIRALNGRFSLTWNGPGGMQDLKVRDVARDFVEQLNRAGKDGWEAVGYTSAMSNAAGGTSCLLRRPLE